MKSAKFFYRGNKLCFLQSIVNSTLLRLTMSQNKRNNKPSSACLPRLKREIVELYNEPLKGIKVKLHENDITSMCLILTLHQGPFSNLILHCKVKIPDGYPQQAPVITIQTPVKHPNVFE